MNLSDPLCARLVDDAHLTLLLDLDGTLIPFAATAEDAKLDAAGVALLHALHEAAVQVVIVSGRPQHLVAPLRALLPHAWLVAEHGSWRCDGDGWRGPADSPELDDLTALLAAFAQTPGARLEPKSLSLCLHWREVPAALKAPLIAGAALVCDEWLESHPAFERIAGVEMLEVRRRSANKGSAVAWARARQPAARFIAIGDDVTDDDMFAALHHDELAIGVGQRPSLRIARRLADLASVRAFLRWVVDARTGRATAPFAALQRCVPHDAAPRSPLLVVSNRTPPAVTGKQRPVGGLVSALEAALRDRGGIWLGWSGHDSEGEHPIVVDDEARPIRASFDLTAKAREHFYGGFCNRALWPLFHGFPGRVSYRGVDWQAYVDANERFARYARGLAREHATIWIHDYHLLLTARALRERGFDGPLGLFLHIPFPPRDLFDTLPWADELLAGMCAFDLIGFHTQQWADNFRACLDGHDPARMPELAVLPIGVDPKTFTRSDARPDPEIAGLRATLGARRMILGVDRLDYAKGIPERLLAFEHLLDHVPEWRGKISFVQVSVPSREEVPEYAELRHRVETLVGRINGKFGEADWVPVRYLYRSYDHAVLAQLYRAADVALVTPLRDGLNLVAKEFVIAQDADDPGVLVLSKFAGAAAELGDALLTNPYHADGMAADIDRALRMAPDERRQRHARMMDVLAGRTPDRWATAFLDRLASAKAS